MRCKLKGILDFYLIQHLSDGYSDMNITLNFLKHSTVSFQENEKIIEISHTNLSVVSCFEKKTLIILCLQIFLYPHMNFSRFIYINCPK